MMCSSLPTYSIAIRTLGTAGDKFRRELESVRRQTIAPERVLVYIAEGYPRPEFSIGAEEYVWVKKGMVAQRALPYDGITSDCILLLDDDVELAPDSAERLLKAMAEHGADAVGADVFRNHKMGFRTKVYAAATNLVFPHWSRKWAFKVRRNGSFSYNARPSRSFYWSQSCGGPAQLWRKEVWAQLRMEDELWLESLGFPYGEDLVETYKLYSNGGRLGVLYDAGVANLDAQSSSGGFRRSPEHIYVRTKALFMIWYRCLFRTGKDTVASRLLSSVSFGLKTAWMVFVMCGAAAVRRDGHFVTSFFKGLEDGRKAVRTEAFRSIPNYCLRQR